MIAQDQPTIFDDNVIVALSSVDDGNMSFKYDKPKKVLRNRSTFLQGVGIAMENTTLLQLSFENVTDFARYTTLTDVQKGEGMFDSDSTTIADALVVTKPGHAIFLPVGDCAATVIYDPSHKILMMSHLGRQSAEVYGAKKSIEYLEQKFKSNPEELKIWMSPAVGKESYRLYGLDHKGLHEAILEQFHDAGVLSSNIEASPISTATSKNYFSHSAALKDESVTKGRFAVVAVMRVQGEPAS